MQRYLTHLLADLETATRNAPTASSYRFRHPFDDHDERDTPAYNTRYVRLCDLFGLPAGVFPPSERLTKNQVTALLTAFESLWRAWNVAWDCPPRLTARRRYAIMVERMEQEPVRYNHELGTTVDFCDRRSEGGCPFADRSQCWCEELEACARHDLDLWENAHDLDDLAQLKISPTEELRKWLGDAPFGVPPWEEEGENQRWHQFFAGDDSMHWLFFFDPNRGRDLADDTQEPSPEDYEDFDWHDDDDDDDYGEMPF
ncbi:MAG: hypothetical protein ABMA02_16205 [Saprospiraceae bacterium]